MCGIAGFCSLKRCYTDRQSFWENILVSMHEKLIHRGGDASGIYLTHHAGLSHQRLSIRDITHGAQPMIRHRDGADYAIVYNGEIYNTDELIPELTAAGYNFLTTSDTEVILYAYMHFGASFVSRLNGIFSFAIWDGAAKQLFLYRDRVGTKPLFYHAKDGELVFASEPKALFCFPDLSPAITEKLPLLPPVPTLSYHLLLKFLSSNHSLSVSHTPKLKYHNHHHNQAVLTQVQNLHKILFSEAAM